MIRIDTIYTNYYSNTYVLHIDNNAYIIDCGAKLEEVKKLIKDEDKVIGILITHSHYDHLINIYDYLDYYKCNLYISNKAKEMYGNSEHNVSDLFGENVIYNFDKYNIIYLNDSEIIDNLIYCINTPGHTIDSVSYIVEDKIFTGDLLFSGSVGRCDFYSGDSEELNKSISKLYNYNKSINYFIYPGHGDSSNLQKELLFNPYVRHAIQ